VKYFFLAADWSVGRVWEFGGLWNATARRRDPDVRRLDLCILEQGQPLWLYQVEDDVLMLEVKPTFSQRNGNGGAIGQVTLKRLIAAEAAIARLAAAERVLCAADLHALEVGG